MTFVWRISCMARFLALAIDYDGTLPHDGHVDDGTVAAVHKLRGAGCKVILATGRQVPELKSVFPAIAVCDIAVAENGGLCTGPATIETKYWATEVTTARSSRAAKSFGNNCTIP
jgi:HAD superfamily hydrolase (TIGR01484 family)